MTDDGVSVSTQLRRAGQTITNKQETRCPQIRRLDMELDCETLESPNGSTVFQATPPPHGTCAGPSPGYYLEMSHQSSQSHQSHQSPSLRSAVMQQCLGAVNRVKTI
ncbi:hypothetical protein EYF80_039005 [Liparis tanakae]|uniref:Uncharacterized protein n=1 Tax=Liparis tanakae TaxID=230148 RepID=A0A4Z2GD08_9TELE|nr:hypothetical protein EYF80_039005 [Liparis tanakae]